MALTRVIEVVCPNTTHYLDFYGQNEERIPVVVAAPGAVGWVREVGYTTQQHNCDLV